MDGMMQIAEARRSLGDIELERFAMQVVAQIVGVPVIETGPPGKELLRLMVRHARSGDPRLLSAAYSHISAQRIPAERVVDVYLPSAAREIGRAWHDGELDILGATLSIARLQAILRELGRAWSADHAPAISTARVILVVPQNEQHTLGPLIVLQQLRRFGISVNMQLMPSPVRLARLVAENSYDAVFISIANLSNLESCRLLVNTVKRSAQEVLPVAVGGAMVDHAEDVRAATGADVVTNNVGLALEACGLRALDRMA